MDQHCWVRLVTWYVLPCVVKFYAIPYNALAFPDDVYSKNYRWVEEGDINIGVILPIHSSISLFNCTDHVVDARKLQNVEAVSFAVREINKENNILPNLTLGFHILDDCQSPSIALARAIQFMPRDIRSNDIGFSPGRDTFGGVNAGEDRTFYDVVGVIGAYTSKLSIVIANVLTLFKLPQISHTATSDVLSDKSRFPYFFRMVPPDRYQVKAIASILRHFSWSHVFIVYSEGSYGHDGMKELRSTFQVMKHGVCIEEAIEIADGSTENDFLKILKRLNMHTDTRVVVAFVEMEHATFIINAVETAGLRKRFIWVGSDSLSLVLEENPMLCDNLPGSMSVHPFASNISTERFSDHLNRLNSPDTGELSRNPWLNELQEYYRNSVIYNSTLSTQMPTCVYNKDDYKVRSTFVDSFLIDSVYALAYALDNVVASHCNPNKIGSEHVAECVSTVGIFDELKVIRYTGPHGELEFNEYGDAVAKYVVHQCVQKEADRGPEMRTVGLWDMELNINKSNMLWPSSTIPSSSCPKPCTETTGTIYYFMKQTCCHVCVTCKVNEIVAANATRCEICPDLLWPEDQTRTTCIPITPHYCGITNPVSIGLCVAAIVGAVLCFWIIVILLRYRDEHVVKGFSLELSSMILLGTLLTYVLAVSFLSSPASWKCYVNYVGFSLTYAMIYAPLLVKTNRIYRIFNAGKRTARKPCFISTSSQVFFSLILICCQVAIVIVSTSLEPPKLSLHMPHRTHRFVELFCNLPQAGLLSSLSYNLVLVVICTFYAFKTRKLPDNYKESRYIAFCVDTTLLIWITFVPTYFTATRATAKTTILSISLLLNASVTVTCLFLPRMYSLYKSLKNTSSSATHHYKDFRIVKHVVKRKHSSVLEITELESLQCTMRRVPSALTCNSDVVYRDQPELGNLAASTQTCLQMVDTCTNDVDE